MNNISGSLKKLGFDAWYESRLDSSKLANLELCRVIAVDKESYLVKKNHNAVKAEITGKIMFSADSPLDFPTVGDWVYAQYMDNDSFAIIHEILPRKSILQRKTSGKKTEFQLIAANIDTAFIIQALDSNYNLRRMERYLAMINEGDINPVVLLSKSDLLSLEEIDAKVDEIYSIMPDLQVLSISNKTSAGIDRLMSHLTYGKTYCLLGSSGVGKTTLLNNLLGGSFFDTQSVRDKDGKGRHTTTRRQLISLENNAMIIDTPGMRELGNIGIESGIDDTFNEIIDLSALCKYNDCTHTQENGCAVTNAVKQGTISKKRYENYLKMTKESAFYESSYLEKRRKDKKFGKMVKSVMKNNQKK